MMAPLEGSWTRRGLRGGSTGSAPKFMVQIPHRRPEGSAPAGAFRRPTRATPRLLGRRWPPYRVIVRKCRMIYTPVRGTSRTPSPTKIREKFGTKFAGAVSHSTGGVRCPRPTRKLQVHHKYFMAIPHNSKCRYGERGAADAKPKAQIILDVLSSILATQMPCRSRWSGA